MRRDYKRYRSHLVLFLLLLIGRTGIAGDTLINVPGTVYGRIFSNFHSELNAGDNASAFEIKRAYFGYKRQLSNYFSANVKLDIGSPEDLSEFSLIRRYAYFKNALLKYERKKLEINFGIIDMLHFKLQETYWAHRYIEKSYADAYRFGFSADLGASAEYHVTDWFSVDITLSNGEGYTRLQTDNTFKTAAGMVIYPGYNFVTRLYYDYADKSEVMSTASAFLGYKLEDRFIAGAEYHLRTNDDFTENQQRYGYSAYFSWFFVKKWQVFGRYDKVSSNTPEGEEIPWSLSDDGSKVIGGIEFTPIDNVKLALNYQDWFPYAQNESNEQYIFLNVEVKF
ncbi:MAG: hypothetical protein KDC05_08015 [Bacteroidales bacterium]|nr:hypothetical protein [Bacteroidales bacterium]